MVMIRRMRTSPHGAGFVLSSTTLSQARRWGRCPQGCSWPALPSHSPLQTLRSVTAAEHRGGSTCGFRVPEHRRGYKLNTIPGVKTSGHGTSSQATGEDRPDRQAPSNADVQQARLIVLYRRCVAGLQDNHDTAFEGGAFLLRIRERGASTNALMAKNVKLGNTEQRAHRYQIQRV